VPAGAAQGLGLTMRGRVMAKAWVMLVSAPAEQAACTPRRGE